MHCPDSFGVELHDSAQVDEPLNDQAQKARPLGTMPKNSLRPLHRKRKFEKFIAAPPASIGER